MGYSKTTWADGVTPLSAQNLNKIENQVEGLSTFFHGQATYTDTIPANTEITKTIPIGSSIKNHGRAVFIAGDSTTGAGGVEVFFSIDNAYAHSLYSDKSKLNIDGTVITDQNAILVAITPGNTTAAQNIDVTAAYINSSNLIIKFKNINTTTAYAINTTIFWEVW